jgi:hypothetical protein
MKYSILATIATTFLLSSFNVEAASFYNRLFGKRKEIENPVQNGNLSGLDESIVFVTNPSDSESDISKNSENHQQNVPLSDSKLKLNDFLKLNGHKNVIGWSEDDYADITAGDDESESESEIDKIDFPSVNRRPKRDQSMKSIDLN